MAISDSNVNFINFGAAGISIDSFLEVKSKLINHFKSIYGSDIDVSNATADGVYLNSLALIINNMLQGFNEFVNQMSVGTATGEYLDTLCSLVNVVRKQATSSEAILTFDYSSQSTDKTAILQAIASQVFIDRQGNTWQLKTSATDYGQTYQYITLTQDEDDQTLYHVSMTVKCDVTGPVRVEADDIYTSIDASFMNNVLGFGSSQTYVGADVETDEELRARRIKSLAVSSMTTKEGIEAALLALPTVEDAIIHDFVNNGTRYIVPIVHTERELTTELKTMIANVLYEKMTIGIDTSSNNSNVSDSTDAGNISVTVTTDKLGNPITEKFYAVSRDQQLGKVLDVSFNVKFTMNAFAGSNTLPESFDDTVKNAIMTKLHSLQIGESLNVYDIGSLVDSLIPVVNGSKVAYLSTIYANIKYDGQSVGEQDLKSVFKQEDNTVCPYAKTIYRTNQNNITIAYD